MKEMKEKERSEIESRAIQMKQEREQEILSSVPFLLLVFS